MEQQMVKKSYYQTFLKEGEAKHPLQVLGEAFLAEQTNESESQDLSAIRFAQGEIYFHHDDLEAAIFKWGKIDNELKSWAQKNIADSYFEMGQFKEAEKKYTAINTKNEILSIEVALQLFTLYTETKNLERAYQYIQKAISINPDYPNVTDTACAFYEDQLDWKSAVELAVQEAIRTQSLKWFRLLQEYVDKGNTRRDFQPDDFKQVLMVLYQIDQKQFTQMMLSFWQSYQDKDANLAWLKTANELLSTLEIDNRDVWQELSVIHHESYVNFMNGQYLLQELQPIVPDLLRNWLKMTRETKALFPATAVLAWNEIFPSSIDSSTVKMAETIVNHTKNDGICLENTFDLLEAILHWAENNQFDIEHIKKEFKEEKQITDMLHLIHTTLNELLNQRTAMENELKETVIFHEDIVGRVNGLKNYLTDTELEKIRTLTESYRAVKEKIKNEVQDKIPELLRSSANDISEESDFTSIHPELNERMNGEIQAYFHQDLIPKFRHALQSWIASANQELLEVQTYLEEMAETFSELYEDNKMDLECDFQIIDDWKRDIQRITNRIEIEDENIMNRYQPAQFLLKGAGKLFGTIQKNKALLERQYKKYVENEKYEKVTASIMNKFFLEFDLFEKGLKADMHTFFHNPLRQLEQAIEQSESEIYQTREKLDHMHSYPELFYDPLKLFEMRLWQYELMEKAGASEG